MKHRMPTDKEIRERVEAIGREFEVTDLANIPNNHDSEQYRVAFMYQYLVAGRISEVCGRYAPRRTDAFPVNFKVEGQIHPAVLFAVKTAKRKSERGWTLRPIALPLAKEFEPWAKTVYEYFKQCDREQPFMFAEKPGASKRYAQWVAEKTFEGLEWPMRGYSKRSYVEAPDEAVIDTRVKNGVEEFLIERDDGARKWYKSKKMIPVSTDIYDRWAPFRSHGLRKRRTQTLELFYLFEDMDLKAFGGWEKSGSKDHASDAMKFYLHLDLGEARENLTILKVIAQKYFPKLLKSYEEVVLF